MADKELLWVRIYRGAFWLIQASLIAALIACFAFITLPMAALLFGII